MELDFKREILGAGRDEVGNIPFDLQPKLLSALQKKDFKRLGGTNCSPALHKKVRFENE